jgi:phosphatidylglycerol---prolipoprotein diacylglyceryl transferase
MSVAFIPSPAHGVWHLGPIPVRAYALCMVGGIILAVWVANRRYLRIGGRPGVILDVATWAVPFGLVGARLYSVITDYELYFGAGHDWLGVVKVWDGGLGIPGALAAGWLGAWLACRRAGVSLAPVAGAAAPGLAFGLAAGSWGNWFSQQLYGRPSVLAWAVEISPAHRLPGYENYATFQPTFLYECGWDAATGLLVLWAARRFLLTGDRAFALCLAGYAVGRYGTESLRIDYAHHLFGLRLNQWVMVLVFTAAAGYLYLTRDRLGPDRIAGVQPGGGPVLPRPGRFGTRPERAGMHR